MDSQSWISVRICNQRTTLMSCGPLRQNSQESSSSPVFSHFLGDECSWQEGWLCVPSLLASFTSVSRGMWPNVCLVCSSFVCCWYRSSGYQYRRISSGAVSMALLWSHTTYCNHMYLCMYILFPLQRGHSSLLVLCPCLHFWSKPDFVCVYSGSVPNRSERSWSWNSLGCRKWREYYHAIHCSSKDACSYHIAIYRSLFI